MKKLLQIFVISLLCAEVYAQSDQLNHEKYWYYRDRLKYFVKVGTGKIFRFFAAISLLILLFAGCKKYEEGPLISLYSAENRLSNSWEITEFMINDTDSLETIENRLVLINLDEDDYQTIHFSDIDANGNWELINDKKVFSIDIEFRHTENSSLSIFFPGSYTEWEIIRLSKKDFWLQTTYDGNEYYLKMKQKNLNE